MLPLSKKTSFYITTKLVKINPFKIKKNVTKYKFLINRKKLKMRNTIRPLAAGLPKYAYMKKALKTKTNADLKFQNSNSN